MVKEQERKDHGKRDPDGELLLDRHAGKGIQNKKPRHCDRHGRCIVDINRAHEITLLAFKLQAAVETIVVHGEGAPIQVTHVTARTPETKAGAE